MDDDEDFRSSVLLWHHTVRTRATKEKLFFWRFAIQTFDISVFVPKVDALLQSYADPPRSYAIYDTFGSWDVLLRCWFPASVSPDDFELHLLSQLESLGADSPQYIAVHDILRIDAWDDEGILAPTAGDGDQVDAHAIDRHNARVASAMLDRVANRTSIAEEGIEVDVESDGQAALAHRRDAAASGVIAPLWLNRRGVRSLVSFAHPRTPLTTVQRADVNRRLQRICSSVSGWGRREFAEAPRISLYSGYGTWSNHLITVQAPDGHFYDLARYLSNAIDEDALADTYPGMRPTTTVYASPQPALIRESLTVQAPRRFSEENLDPLREDETLEVKASVWLDVRAYYETGRLTPFAGGLDAVAKAACGMLNRDGGLIVVGLTELNRLPKERGKPVDLSIVADRGLPVTPSGDIAIVGLEREYENPGAQRVQDWDSWMRSVLDGIHKRISPDPVAMFCVSIEELKLSARYDNRTLGIIVVRPPVDRGNWFYMDDQFFVRRQGETVPLRGQLMDAYRNALVARS